MTDAAIGEQSGMAERELGLITEKRNEP